MSKCDTCKHKYREWYDDPCDGCCGNHSGYEPEATCAGCTYWDGDDGRCRNPNSRGFMQETDDGCERREE